MVHYGLFYLISNRENTCKALIWCCFYSILIFLQNELFIFFLYPNQTIFHSLLLRFTILWFAYTILCFSYFYIFFNSLVASTTAATVVSTLTNMMIMPYDDTHEQILHFILATRPRKVWVKKESDPPTFVARSVARSPLPSKMVLWESVCVTCIFLLYWLMWFSWPRWVSRPIHGVTEREMVSTIFL